MENLTPALQGVADRRASYVANRIVACDPFSGTSGDMIARFPLRHSCQHCKEEVISALRTMQNKIVLLRNIDQAIGAAIDGCSLYEWLIDFLIRSRSDKAIEEEQAFYLHPKCIPRTESDVYSITFMIGTHNYSWPCADFDVFAEAENPAASYITTRPFNGNVGSAASFQAASDWVLNCHKNHKKCFSSQTGYLPTRLIDLRSKDSGLIKIMPSYAYWSSKKAIYAILSYCWGGDQGYKTTKANLRTYQNRIEVSQVGRTIQDAIKVARSLRIDFLWIDSLCIIQDDPTDVVAEIGRMSEYFENSYVCISAAIATSSREGFLAPRTSNPYRDGPFVLPYRGPDNRSGSLKIATHHEYSSDLDPITARAWIMQESLLAPRVLWYGYRNLAWSCQTFNRSDGGPYREWHNFKDRLNWGELQDNMIQNLDYRGFDGLSHELGPIEAWKMTVQSYTARTLTVANDKLPAISGIAQKYPRIILRHLHEWVSQSKSMTHNYLRLHCTEKDLIDMKEISCPEYVAGIWKIELPLAKNYISQICYSITCQQLLWTTLFCRFHQSNELQTSWKPYTRACDEPVARRRAQYIAPTWSWASVDGPILYEGWERRICAPEFRFLRFTADPKTPGAPFGSVESGYLVIKGRMRDAVPDERSSWVNIVYRPDTRDDDFTLATILSGAQQGKIVELIEHGSGEKPKHPLWTPRMSKGLLLVSVGEHYRRIGLFSLEISLIRDYYSLQKDLSLFYDDELQEITII